MWISAKLNISVGTFNLPAWLHLSTPQHKCWNFSKMTELQVHFSFWHFQSDWTVYSTVLNPVFNYKTLLICCAEKDLSLNLQNFGFSCFLVGWFVLFRFQFGVWFYLKNSVYTVHDVAYRAFHYNVHDNIQALSGILLFILLPQGQDDCHFPFPKIL